MCYPEILAVNCYKYSKKKMQWWSLSLQMGSFNLGMYFSLACFSRSIFCAETVVELYFLQEMKVVLVWKMCLMTSLCTDQSTLQSQWTSVYQTHSRSAWSWSWWSFLNCAIWKGLCIVVLSWRPSWWTRLGYFLRVHGLFFKNWASCYSWFSWEWYQKILNMHYFFIALNCLTASNLFLQISLNHFCEHMSTILNSSQLVLQSGKIFFLATSKER